MVERGGNPNRNRHESSLTRLIAEVPYGFTYLMRSLEQKTHSSEDEALEFLQRAQYVLPENNPYVSKCETLQKPRLLGTGYHAHAYAFSAHSGEWVIKLGVPHSPMRSYFPPSSPQHANWYQYVLDAQREVFIPSLPTLIPEPQSVFHLEVSKRSTTVILQPLIPDITSFENLKNLTTDQRNTLQGEWKLFKSLCDEMQKRYGLAPDFMRARNHLVVSKVKGEAHLVLLDNGPFDDAAPTPFFNWLNKRAVTLRGLQLQRKL